jgi:hypothetical protein
MVLEPRAILSIIALTKKNHPGKTISCFCQKEQKHSLDKIPGDQEGLFKLAVQLRKFFNSVIYNTATGYVLLVYLTNI